VVNVPFLCNPVITDAEGSGGGTVFASVCLCVCFPHDISQTDAARITKLGLEMFHDEFRKPIYFVSNVQRSRSRVSETLPTWVFALL